MNHDSDPDELLERWKPHNEIVGPYKPEAQALGGLFSQYPNYLKTAEYGGRKVIVTPEVSFVHGSQYANAYFFKDRTRRDLTTGSVSCYIDVQAQGQKPAKVYRFNLDPSSGIASDIDALDANTFSDPKLLADAVSTLRGDFINMDRDRAIARKSRVKAAAWFAAFLTLSGGIYGGIVELESINAHNARKATAARKAFDATDFVLPGNTIDVSPVDVTDVDPKEFGLIPSYKEHDSLLDARKFNLDEKTCKTFSTPIKLGEKILIATSKTDNIQSRRIIAGVDNQHDLVVCSTESYPGSYQTWTLAVEAVK